ncbi:hypothetical protein [Hymenobacter swuensis]|uniref:Uncharacterized protein n=1 Tax=Hymenobacter swuensis DY53 TaxID=1227739 RepID=W8F8J5_9BACT|nr:hypothetical protein [Hymenobacter swuensis]AHJ98035.1 hypothetical protein Hsw_2440 [Hymenobacter swuensis DY53]
MKIDQRLNTLTYQEYNNLLSQRQKYTDLNTLGLFRSILENEKLDLLQKIAIRDQAMAAFHKTFGFLQLKDPVTYFELTTLGQQLTVADEAQRWADIRANQRKILSDKKLRHRNFGTYSKHICWDDTCPLNGVMLQQDRNKRAVRPMSFCFDKNQHTVRLKAIARKQDRKFFRQSTLSQFDEK